ncbi:MAG: hypothetical protein KKF27_20530 [Gammaproteobacteria bacterium]|nr:hypothetical protein [Gammaproteobacteria bacterium]
MKTYLRIAAAGCGVVLGLLVVLGADLAGYTRYDYLQVRQNLQVDGNLAVTGTITGTGAQDITGDLTLENDEIIGNGTDAVVELTYNDDAVELGDLQIYSSNTSTATNDYFRLSWWFEDSGSAKTEYAYLDVGADDITTGSSDASITLGVVTADTLADELILTGSALYPASDAGLDLGKSDKEYNDLYVDGTANIDSLVADTADVNGGTVDGVVVGANADTTATLLTGTITTLNATTANVGTGYITTLATSSTIGVLSYNFYDEDVAANQSAAAWGLQAGANVGGGIQGVIMPYAGSVVGISVLSNDTDTSDTFTADATIDGSVTGLQAGLLTADLGTSYTTQAQGEDTFTAGQAIGAKITTDANWLPTTADVVVTVFVKFD